MPVNFRDLSAHPTINFNLSDFLSTCDEPFTAAQKNATHSDTVNSVLQDSQDSHWFSVSVSVTCERLNGRRWVTCSCTEPLMNPGLFLQADPHCLSASVFDFIQDSWSDPCVFMACFCTDSCFTLGVFSSFHLIIFITETGHSGHCSSFHSLTQSICCYLAKVIFSLISLSFITSFIASISRLIVCSQSHPSAVIKTSRFRSLSHPKCLHTALSLPTSVSACSQQKAHKNTCIHTWAQKDSACMFISSSKSWSG